MKACLRRYGPPAASIAALYILNRFWLVSHTSRMLHRLLVCHFADFLAGGLMLCVLDCALELSGHPPLRRAASALGFTLLCGAFWELVTPLYLPRSVGDWRDVIAVCLDGLAMFFILNPRKKR